MFTNFLNFLIPVQFFDVCTRDVKFKNIYIFVCVPSFFSLETLDLNFLIKCNFYLYTIALCIFTDDFAAKKIQFCLHLWRSSRTDRL